MKEIKITKIFNHKMSRNYKSLDFGTSLTETFQIETAQELKDASKKLFEQARWLTMKDIENNKETIEKFLSE